MPYLVVVIGIAAIAIMWWTYYQDVTKKQGAHKDSILKAGLSRIFGTGIAILLI